MVVDRFSVVSNVILMTYRFTIVLTPEDDWFVARAVELGVVSQGKTVEEATKNIQEAIELYLEDGHFSKKKLLHKESSLVTSVEVKYA